MSDARCQMSDVSEVDSRITQFSTDIWHLTSDIYSWGNYANTVTRPALRRANVVEEARLHCCSRYHARPGHRREHHDVQRHQRIVVAAHAVQRTGAARASGGEGSEGRVRNDGVIVYRFR